MNKILISSKHSDLQISITVEN